MSLTPTPIPTRLAPTPRARNRVSSPADTDVVLFTEEGTIERLVAVNASSNARYIQVHDAETLPIDTTVPLYSRRIPADGEVVIEDVYCVNGAVVVVSDTADTLTISTDTAHFYATFRR